MDAAFVPDGSPAVGLVEHPIGRLVPADIVERLASGVFMTPFEAQMATWRLISMGSLPREAMP